MMAIKRFENMISTLSSMLLAVSDKVYQLLAHGGWFSLGTPLLPTLKLVAMI
jgi:hypothetical protein